MDLIPEQEQVDPGLIHFYNQKLAELLFLKIFIGEYRKYESPICVQGVGRPSECTWWT